MSSDPASSSPDFPDSDDGADLGYSIEVIAELAGVDTTTLLHYQEQGFLRPSPHQAGSDAASGLDIESLRQLRRIGYLRDTCGVNETGLKLILSLLTEVEQLREECRQLRR